MCLRLETNLVKSDHQIKMGSSSFTSKCVKHLKQSAVHIVQSIVDVFQNVLSPKPFSFPTLPLTIKRLLFLHKSINQYPELLVYVSVVLLVRGIFKFSKISVLLKNF